MCRDPERKFRRRTKFVRKEKTVFLDVMLDLAQMRQASREERRRIIRERLAEEVPAVIQGYGIGDFDHARFAEDLKKWLANHDGTQVS